MTRKSKKGAEEQSVESGQKLSRPAVLLHPIRSRLFALLHRGPTTVDDLIRLMPDVPTGSLYRHLNLLVESDLVVVTGKQGVRGPKARIFSIGPEKGFFTEEERSEVGPAEMAQLITSVSDAVTQAGYAWTAHPDFDLDHPGSAVVVSALDLTADQFQHIRDAVRTTWAAGMENASGAVPKEQTKKWIIGYFAIPVLEDVPSDDENTTG